MKSTSELRQDLVSGEWVVIATGRARRPHEFLKQKRIPFVQPRSTCPFEKLDNTVLAVHSLDGNGGKENWWVEVKPNKYPAFGRGTCGLIKKEGPYRKKDGVGFHEVVITRDHLRSIALMSDEEVELIMRSYQDRFLALGDEKCVSYITVIHNHGRQSGATISHPHSQIIAIPVIPPDINRSLHGSAAFFKKEKKCVHCYIISYEKRVGSRIIYENDRFVVISPFASKTAFEIRIFPKRHQSRFEEIEEKDRFALANAMRVSLAKLYGGLKNPDYNFFLHTAPFGKEKDSGHYHWHFEIVPKTNIWGGFEFATGIEISAIAPEDAAGFLRKVKVRN